jgi:hypothetical protein
MGHRTDRDGPRSQCVARPSREEAGGTPTGAKRVSQEFKSPTLDLYEATAHSLSRQDWSGLACSRWVVLRSGRVLKDACTSTR